MSFTSRMPLVPGDDDNGVALAMEEEPSGMTMRLWWMMTAMRMPLLKLEILQRLSQVPGGLVHHELHGLGVAAGDL